MNPTVWWGSLGINIVTNYDMLDREREGGGYLERGQTLNGNPALPTSHRLLPVSVNILQCLFIAWNDRETTPHRTSVKSTFLVSVVSDLNG